MKSLTQLLCVIKRPLLSPRIILSGPTYSKLLADQRVSRVHQLPMCSNVMGT